MTTRDIMLNEQLQVIHILNEFDLSGIKAKAKNISKIAASGNVLKFNDELSKLKGISIPELKTVARKKFSSEYKQATKEVDEKIRSAPEILKDILILCKASLLKLKNEIQDVEYKEKIQEALKKFDDMLKHLQNKGLAEKGITIILIAFIVSFFLVNIPIVTNLLFNTGVILIAAAIFVYVARIIVDIFIVNKKKGKKVVEL